MAALLFLTYLAIVILIGIICAILSNKAKIPNVLLLLLTGIVLKNITFQGKPLVEFPPVFITSISILALTLIVFDSASRFKFKEFDEFSFSALKLTAVFIILTMVFLTIATDYMFEPGTILLSIMFASLMAGTSPGAVLAMIKGTKNKVLELLEVESIVNTPFIVLIPFLLVDLMLGAEGSPTLHIFIEQIQPFSLQIITGIGTGVLIGLVVFRIMRKQYSEQISPLALIGAALLTYVLSEFLGGNGVLAVTVAGIMFGTFYIKEKTRLLEYSLVFSNFLEIIVFIFVGLLVELSFDLNFILPSLGLFGIFLAVRFISINLSFIRKEYNFKEKLFMTLNAPKGIAVAVVASTLLVYAVAGTPDFIPGMKLILDLVLLFLLYSIILSTVVIKFSRYFLRLKVIK
ncbi:cation:proton antiporter [Candidatus Woesearchaeota archaeon]|nr:cation:proton antiporter [Candidatus Woesearchaeota archaeon]MBW3021587.1 cation:proton antiporter [Candidatus Woesearchaeota archaeon]